MLTTILIGTLGYVLLAGSGWSLLASAGKSTPAPTSPKIRA